MENNNGQSGFSYTYSAGEQAEIRKIRDKYTSREEDKMERLRCLDRSVAQKAQTAALIFGVVGTLILGFGMSLAMSELSAMLGLNDTMAMLLGVVIGVIGGVLASLAYPIYSLVLKLERAKAAPEIIRLTDELMK